MNSIPQTDSKVIIDLDLGWNYFTHNDAELWICGYLYNHKPLDLIDKISFLFDANTTNKINNFISGMDGCFAFVIRTRKHLVFAVDQVASIPLFFSNLDKLLVVSSDPSMIREKLTATARGLDNKSLTEISMSGYAINRKTIYKSISKLQAGEFAIKDDTEDFSIQRYFSFKYSVSSGNYDYFKSVFLETTLSVLRKMSDDLKGKNIVIPLSAGNDSRLIASGLKHLQVVNVICFTYGKKKSTEVRVGRKIALKLGYKWIHIPLSLKTQKSFFESDYFSKYENTVDTFNAVQFIQDILAIKLFKELRNNPNDVIVNGNTGDFICGAHIPTLNSHHKNYLDSFLDKHYSLWQDLRNSKNDNMIKNQLRKSLSFCYPDVNLDTMDYNHYEFLEWLGRQSNFIVQMQRSYDFNRLLWRMPFWDKDYMKFWGGVPLKFKLNGNLYSKVLREENFGGVWSKEFEGFDGGHILIKVFRKIIRLFLLIFDKRLSKRLNKNLFYYYLDDSGGVSFTPYYKYLFDKRGFRNRVSFRSAMYIKKKLSLLK